jgi:hypothetical protein
MARLLGFRYHAVRTTRQSQTRVCPALIAGADGPNVTEAQRLSLVTQLLAIQHLPCEVDLDPGKRALVFRDQDTIVDVVEFSRQLKLAIFELGCKRKVQ